MRQRTAVIVLSTLFLCQSRLHAQATGGTFYTAIRNNDLPALEQLLRKPGPAARDPRGTTPLMLAAALGSLDAMKRIVDAGADVNAANDFGATALMWAAGDLHKVSYLLSKGASVTARSKVGRTPLMIAAMYDGSVEIGRLLIEKGADVKAKDKSGATALANAAYVNNVDLARLLLSKGADPNAVDPAGFTPLLLAAGSGDRSAAFVKLLLDHGAAVNVKCIDSVERVKNGDIAIGRLTPLLSAMNHGNYETIEMLIRAGADLNAKDVRGMTPLMLAIATDRPDPRVIRLLLSKGADVKLTSKAGDTAADWARKYNEPAILEVLGLKPAKPVEPATHAATRSASSAIEKSVALMQTTSAQFLEKGGCLGCHAQHITGMAVAAAKAVGVPVNWKLESEQARAASSLRGSLEQTLFQVVDPATGTDGHAFSLLQIDAAGLPPRLSVDSLLFHLVGMQRKEGDWPNYGIARPPLEDGGFSITAKAIRVLRENMIPGRKAEFEERIARAANWLKQQTPRSTEDRTMQILGIRWADRTPPAERVKELVDRQRSNGGWGQTDHLPADAYATGEALYALHVTGMPATDPVYRRGVAYLLGTQHDDGSWHVKTRAAGFQPYFQSGFPHDHDQWISQAGTAWAAIALSFAVEKPKALADARSAR